MAATTKPILAITMGDPAGVGPEVILRAWPDPRIHASVRPFVVGHPAVIQKAVTLVGGTERIVELKSIDDVKDLGSEPAVVPVVNVCSDDAAIVPTGVVDARSGEAAYQCVTAAARWALEKRIDGLVTAPLSKSALHAAGHHYPGHTELLAEMCGVRHFAMMLYLPPGDLVRAPAGLGVAHVTLHQSMRAYFRI